MNLSDLDKLLATRHDNGADFWATPEGRFQEAFETLRQKLDSNNMLIVERPNRKLITLDICRPGLPSAAATERYLEIVNNLKNGK